MHGLGCSASARRYSRNHCCFLFLRVLRCFSSPRSPPLRDFPIYGKGCPSRTPADHFVCSDPRAFSQHAASFVASESLGIPRAPLSTCNRPPARADGLHCPALGGDFSVAILAQHFKEPCAPHTGAGAKHAGKTNMKKLGFPERRCSSRTFRYGYLVT